MGRVLILYYSETGHTQGMAQLVAEGAREVEGTEVRVREIEKAGPEDLLWCDGIALGAPTHLGNVPWKVKKWWDGMAKEVWQKIDGKIGTAFTSSGGWGGGGELTCQALMTILMNFGILVFGVTDYVSKKLTLHYGSVCAKEAREEDAKDSCRRLGKRLAEWVAVLCDGRKQISPLVTRYKRNPWDKEEEGT